MLASADERLTRGLTSMTAYSKLSGFSANWQLQPPSTSSADTISSAARRSMPHSLSESVSAGAATMLSPVCTPTGSKFSMLQMVMTLPALSRITSNSISFQPEIHFSTNICVMGESLSPLPPISRSAAGVSAMPPPVPPSVNAGRTMTGYPMLSAKASASSMFVTTLDGITGWPISSIVSLKRCLSSALSMVSGLAPSSFTLYLSKNPLFASCMDSVSPVCPPRVDNRLSGLSFSMMRSMVSSVSGSM